MQDTVPCGSGRTITKGEEVLNTTTTEPLISKQQRVEVANQVMNRFQGG